MGAQRISGGSASLTHGATGRPNAFDSYCKRHLAAIPYAAKPIIKLIIGIKALIKPIVRAKPPIKPPVRIKTLVKTIAGRESLGHAVGKAGLAGLTEVSIAPIQIVRRFAIDAIGESPPGRLLLGAVERTAAKAGSARVQIAQPLPSSSLLCAIQRAATKRGTADTELLETFTGHLLLRAIERIAAKGRARPGGLIL